MRFAAALLIVCCCWLDVGKPSSLNNLPNWLVLDSHDKFNVSWTVEGETITFTVTCETTGWVGLGFSPSGSMADADIIVAWVADDGSSYLLDMYATSKSLPIEDTSQDVRLISALEANGITKVQFQRKLDTCDDNDDNIITSSTTRLIYAYQTSDPKDNRFTSTDYHGYTNRGSKSVYLLESTTGSKPTSFPADAKTLDFRVNNYNVPAEDTTYYCAFITPPKLEEIHHIISIEPFISEGSEGLIHHILLFACYGLSEERIRNNNKTEGICYTDEMPEFSDNCFTTIHGWANGGGAFYFPVEAGYPIGGSDGSSPNYFQIQIHYDNPGLLNTIVDSSGLRATYTPTIREQEAAVFRLGFQNGIAVPPTADKFKVMSYCNSECTNQFLPEEGIEIYAYLLHTHLLGKAMHIEWYRDGKNIGFLAFDDSYDFNFQETRRMEKNKRLLPGDSLKITCTFNNEVRDFVTFGGAGTKEEMCFAYIFYYPRQNLTTCSSSPGLYNDPTDPVYAQLSVNASTENTIFAINQVSDWTDDTVAVLQNGFDKTPHFSFCYRENYIPYEGMHSLINRDGYPEMERKEQRKCYSKGGEADANSAGSIQAALYSLSLIFVVTFY